MVTGIGAAVRAADHRRVGRRDRLPTRPRAAQASQCGVAVDPVPGPGPWGVRDRADPGPPHGDHRLPALVLCQDRDAARRAHAGRPGPGRWRRQRGAAAHEISADTPTWPGPSSTAAATPIGLAPSPPSIRTRTRYPATTATGRHYAPRMLTGKQAVAWTPRLICWTTSAPILPSSSSRHCGRSTSPCPRSTGGKGCRS
jgi:hypothetical protein